MFAEQISNDMANDNVQKITLTLRNEDIKFIQTLSHEEDRSMSDIVRQIIKKAREQKTRPDKTGNI
jgi:hypothetical protein